MSRLQNLEKSRHVEHNRFLFIDLLWRAFNKFCSFNRYPHPKLPETLDQERRRYANPTRWLKETDNFILDIRLF
jgi:hypothetical protein